MQPTEGRNPPGESPGLQSASMAASRPRRRWPEMLSVAPEALAHAPAGIVIRDGPLIRLAVVWNTPVACNGATVDFLSPRRS